VALAFDGVTVDVGSRRLLDAISLETKRGDFVALIGPNGAGKTTLLRAALALVPLTSGSVRIGGMDVRRVTGRKRAGMLAWLPQHMAGWEPVTAEELVAAARYRFGEAHSVAVAQARAALEHARAAPLASRKVTELSGGERQRVLIAAMLAQRAPILLLDEPASHLDPAQQIELYRLLDELWREGLTIICVTHDVNLLRHLHDADRVRVVGLRSGRVALDSAFSAAAFPSELGRLFDVEIRAVPLPRGAVFVVERARGVGRPDSEP
jgi:iron complex transport system ATP-binding protein